MTNALTRSVLAAVILMSSSMVAPAGINSFTAIGPEGGSVRKVVYNPTTPTTVHMIAGAGALRSSDEGATWQLVKGDFFSSPSDLEVDPADGNRVYVVSASTPTMLVSDDGGTTFTGVSSFPNVGNVWQLEVSSDGRTLYANSGLRVFRSTDRGVTWVERAAPTASGALISVLRIVPTDSNTLYAIAPVSQSLISLYVTHDGASTWTQLSTALPVGNLHDIAVSATNPARIWIAGEQGLYVSSDGGQHFFANYSPVTSNTVSAVAINPANSSQLVIGDPSGFVYRSLDEGATWVDITDNVVVNGIEAIALGPQPSSQLPHVFVGGAGGIELSTVGGTNWTRREKGFRGTTITNFSADPSSDRIYIGATGSGVHYVQGGTGTTTAVNNTNLSSLAQIPTTFFVPSVLAQDGTPGRLFASLSTKIAQTLDGGATWSLTGFPLQPAHQAATLTSSPLDPQVILAGLLNGNGLERSPDRGHTWVPATTGLPTGAVATVVSLAASDASVAYCAPYTFNGIGPATHYGVYRSVDAGLTWSPMNTGIEHLGVGALVVDPTDAQTVYISADSRTWRSTNGGAVWTQLASQPWQYTGMLAVDPMHPQIIYASGLSSIARSINRGESWEILRSAQSQPFWAASALLPDPLRPHVLLVGTEQSGAQQITIAPDLQLVLDPSAEKLQVGQSVSYHYTLYNLGPYHATGVKLAVHVPATAQSVTVLPGAGTCTAQGGTHYTCVLDAVRAGFTADFTVQASPSEAGAFQVSATASSDQPDSVTTNNTVDRDATAADPVDVSVSATGPSSVERGTAARYSLVVNTGSGKAARSVQLTYQIAAGLTPGVVSTTVGTCSTTDATVSCNLGDLAANGAATITVDTTAATAGSQSSSASVTTSSFDTQTANNTASVTTNVTTPAPPATPAPPTPPAPPASQGGGGGGRMSPLWLLLLGMIAMLRVVPSRDLAMRKAAQRF